MNAPESFFSFFFFSFQKRVGVPKKRGKITEWIPQGRYLHGKRSGKRTDATPWTEYAENTFDAYQVCEIHTPCLPSSVDDWLQIEDVDQGGGVEIDRSLGGERCKP